MVYLFKRTFESASRLSGFKLPVIIGLVALSVTGFYVWLMTENSVKNYKIRDLQTKTEELGKLNRELEVTSANSQTVTTLNSQIAGLGMVSSDKVDYISVVDKVMVKR